MVGRIMCLCGGILYHGLVQIRDFFFYNHIMLVKVINVTIFHCVHTFTFCVERSKVMVVSVSIFVCTV